MNPWKKGITSPVTEGRQGGSMITHRKKLAASLLAMALILHPVSALTLDGSVEPQKPQKKPQQKHLPDPGLMTADLILARPAGLVATLGGSVIFIVSLPFSALGGNTEDAWESLVESPASYTFKRPLGEFED